MKLSTTLLATATLFSSCSLAAPAATADNLSVAKSVSNTLSSVSKKASKTTPTLKLRPTPSTPWNIQLISPPPASVAKASPKVPIWDIDLYDASTSLISSLHAANISVICYFSAGSYENWRSDASSWPAAALGKDMDGWAGEKWVDVRNSGVRDVMKKRIALAKSKGCDGIDPDNIDGYNNDTGFDLTEADAVSFVTFLSNTAHAAGMSYGLKNGGDIVPQVVHLAEWVVNEECTFYQECDLYKPFIDAGKAVFHIEYPDTKKELSEKKFINFACKAQKNGDQKGFSTLIKKRNLDDWTRTCP